MILPPYSATTKESRLFLVHIFTKVKVIYMIYLSAGTESSTIGASIGGFEIIITKLHLICTTHFQFECHTNKYTKFVVIIRFDSKNLYNNHMTV